MPTKPDVHLKSKVGNLAGENDSNVVVKGLTNGIKTNIVHKKLIF